MFIIKQLGDDNFAIHSAQEFKTHIDKANLHFSDNPAVADLSMKSWDISGCYTNIPKSEVLTAMQATLDSV